MDELNHVIPKFKEHIHSILPPPEYEEENTDYKILNDYRSKIGNELIKLITEKYDIKLQNGGKRKNIKRKLKFKM